MDNGRRNYRTRLDFDKVLERVAEFAVGGDENRSIR